jgi:hypothetical protein
VLDPAIHAVFVASVLAALALLLVGTVMPKRVASPAEDRR